MKELSECMMQTQRFDFTDGSVGPGAVEPRAPDGAHDRQGLDLVWSGGEERNGTVDVVTSETGIIGSRGGGVTDGMQGRKVGNEDTCPGGG